MRTQHKIEAQIAHYRKYIQNLQHSISEIKNSKSSPTEEIEQILLSRYQNMLHKLDKQIKEIQLVIY